MTSVRPTYRVLGGAAAAILSIGALAACGSEAGGAAASAAASAAKSAAASAVASGATGENAAQICDAIAKATQGTTPGDGETVAQAQEKAKAAQSDLEAQAAGGGVAAAAAVKALAAAQGAYAQALAALPQDAKLADQPQVQQAQQTLQSAVDTANQALQCPA